MDVFDHLLSDEPERLLNAKFRTFLGDETVDRYQRLVHRRERGYSAEILASIRAAHEIGVRLLAGTGAGTPRSVAVHWELELFAEAGLPPLDVLRIATLDAATAVGASRHRRRRRSGHATRSQWTPCPPWGSAPVRPLRSLSDQNRPNAS